MTEYFDHIRFAKELLGKQAEINRLRTELEQLRAQLGEPEIQWGHQVHADAWMFSDEDLPHQFYGVAPAQLI